MASVEEAAEKTRETISRRMRLHGIFEPTGENVNELVHREGRGRWVGLVRQQPDGAATVIDSLVVDGKSTAGWRSSSLDVFLGCRGDFHSGLSGRYRGLCWRYLLLEPIDFQKSLVLKTVAPKLGDRLSLFYEAK